MEYKAGTLNDFTSSMAEAIDKAFREEWLREKGYALPETGKRDRHLLFAAIAQGVLRHLHEHAADSIFVRNVRVEQQAGNAIKSKGHVTPDETDFDETDLDVEVTQYPDDASNRVRSTGEGSGIEILTRETSNP